MSDTKQYMIRITDGSERPKSYGGFRWNRVGEWTEAPDWNPVPSCGGGLHGQHPEAGGFRNIGGTVPELVEIDGLAVEIEGKKVKVRRAKRIAVGDLDVPEMPRYWRALNLSGCSKRLRLPSMRVERLDLSENVDLREFPRGLKVLKWLDISGCKGLRKIPAGLTVKWLDLSACTGIRELPEGLKTIRVLYMAGCTGIRELPEGLKLDSLSLCRCTGLRKLPERLTVSAWIDLIGCTGLRKLPEGLEAGNLNVYGCTGLRELPKKMNVKTLDGWNHDLNRSFV